MSDQAGELVRTQTMGVALAEARAVIEPLTAGGIVESAAGPVTARMDEIVQTHLSDVAIRAAAGDDKPERPAYIYNPSSNLLIKFSFHRGGPNESYHGLFADVVELDSEGNAKHGVSSPDIRTAFDSSQGFIPITVGENRKGFTPSSIPLKFEDTDTEVEEEISFPNIELATLSDLMRAEPVGEDTDLDTFLKERTDQQAKTEARVQRRFSSNYMGNEQALGSSTNPNLHLIITDKEDTAEIDRISRELGMFPVFLSIDVAKQGIDHYEQFEGAPTISRFETFFPPGDEWRAARAALSEHTPAFVTYDIKAMTGPEDPDGTKARKINKVTSCLGISDPSRFSDAKPMKARPVFRRIVNSTFYFEADEPEAIRKEAHGHYEMPIEQGNEANMAAYANLLRKAKLDFALTQYLRGIDRL